MVGMLQGERDRKNGTIRLKAPDHTQIMFVGPLGKFNLGDDVLLRLPPKEIGLGLRNFRIRYFRNLLELGNNMLEVHYLDERGILQAIRTLHDVRLTMAHMDGSFDIAFREEEFEDIIYPDPAKIA